jgi:CubicO group peptidase (beta-lactamase class C family)
MSERPARRVILPGSSRAEYGSGCAAMARAMASWNTDRMNRRTAFPMIFAAFILDGCSVPEPAGTRATLVREVSDGRFEPFLEEMETTEHFTGVALILREGKIVHAKGYGAATGRRANGVDTRIHVGSITKQFTAAAIMQLVEKEVLKLDDPINLHLPRKYRSAKWGAVTVHHLLSHTSGITDYAVTRDYYHVVKGFCLGDTVDGMVKEAMGKDLEFEPGSKFSYTNLGYTLLGVVIENETNSSYDDYIKHNILDPMGMTSSRIHGVGHVPGEGEAEGFRWSEEQGRRVPDDVVFLPVTAPDGGLITTLGDFAKWARIFTGGEQTILSPDSIKLMSTPKIVIGNGGPLDSMGYGLYVGNRLVGHGGLIVGFSSQFVFDRETRSLIAVFSNDASANPQQVAFGLLTLLLTPNP